MERAKSPPKAQEAWPMVVLEGLIAHSMGLSRAGESPLLCLLGTPASQSFTKIADTAAAQAQTLKGRVKVEGKVGLLPIKVLAAGLLLLV
jgi:hypothetical protein